MPHVGTEGALQGSRWGAAGPVGRPVAVVREVSAPTCRGPEFPSLLGLVHGVGVCATYERAERAEC